MIARDFVATENKNIQSAIKLAEKNDLRDRPELHYLNARSNGAVWFLLIFIATGSVVYLLFGGDFWLITAWGLLAGSLAGLIAYDYSLRSLSLVRYESFVHIEWENERLEQAQQLINSDEEFYVSLGLHEAIRPLVLSSGKMTRSLLQDNINLADFYAVHRDWTKVYPMVVEYYIRRGLIKEQGGSKVVATNDNWEWQRWMKTPSPTKQLAS